MREGPKKSLTSAPHLEIWNLANPGKVTLWSPRGVQVHQTSHNNPKQSRTVGWVGGKQIHLDSMFLRMALWGCHVWRLRGLSRSWFSSRKGSELFGVDDLLTVIVIWIDLAYCSCIAFSFGLPIDSLTWVAAMYTDWYEGFHQWGCPMVPLNHPILIRFSIHYWVLYGHPHIKFTFRFGSVDAIAPESCGTFQTRDSWVCWGVALIGGEKALAVAQEDRKGACVYIYTYIYIYYTYIYILYIYIYIYGCVCVCMCKIPVEWWWNHSITIRSHGALPNVASWGITQESTGVDRCLGWRAASQEPSREVPLRSAGDLCFLVWSWCFVPLKSNVWKQNQRVWMGLEDYFLLHLAILVFDVCVGL